MIRSWPPKVLSQEISTGLACSSPSLKLLDKTKLLKVLLISIPLLGSHFLQVVKPVWHRLYSLDQKSLYREYYLVECISY